MKLKASRRSSQRERCSRPPWLRRGHRRHPGQRRAPRHGAGGPHLGIRGQRPRVRARRRRRRSRAAPGTTACGRPTATTSRTADAATTSSPAATATTASTAAPTPTRCTAGTGTTAVLATRDGRVHGGDGNDSLFGGWGADRVFGGSGNDELHALAPDGEPDLLELRARQRQGVGASRGAAAHAARGLREGLRRRRLDAGSGRGRELGRGHRGGRRRPRAVHHPVPDGNHVAAPGTLGGGHYGVAGWRRS